MYKKTSSVLTEERVCVVKYEFLCRYFADVIAHLGCSYYADYDNIS